MRNLRLNKPLWSIFLMSISLIGLLSCTDPQDPNAKDVRRGIKNTSWVTRLSSVSANWSVANAVDIITFTSDGQRVWLYNNTQSGLTSFIDPPFNLSVMGHLTGLVTPIHGHAFYFDRDTAHGIIYNGNSPSTGTYGTFDLTFHHDGISTIFEIIVNIGGTTKRYQITPVSSSHLESD